jgi:hypothetical protein
MTFMVKMMDGTVPEVGILIHHWRPWHSPLSEHDRHSSKKSMTIQIFVPASGTCDLKCLAGSRAFSLFGSRAIDSVLFGSHERFSLLSDLRAVTASAYCAPKSFGRMLDVRHQFIFKRRQVFWMRDARRCTMLSLRPCMLIKNTSRSITIPESCP